MTFFLKFLSSSIILFLSFSTNAERWSGRGKLYDERNQYYVLCRLVKEYRVEPLFGDDSVKCHYRCQDFKDEKDEYVITTHSDHVCEKNQIQPRGDKRDWRGR